MIYNWEFKNTGPLEKIVDELKKKNERYEGPRLLEQRKREELARKAQEELQKKLDKEAKKANVEPITVAPAVVEKKDDITRTESGASMSIKLTWQGVIVKPAEVPREYCTPDQRLIDAAVRAGIREIAGVDIKELPKSRLRA